MAVTLFSWGYEGWGNWTEQLIQAVDAVEASRGWGPPVFVDVRASRSVRAVGFRDKAFQERFGPDRYRWMQKLGNAAIVAEGYGLIDPTRAVDLLDLAQELAVQRRRVIFFCSCHSPTADCHRHWITPELLAAAEGRGQGVTVVEWPGFESDSGRLETLEVKPSLARGLGTQRKNLPLGEELPAVEQLARPWFTPVRVDYGGESPGYVLTGPAQHRSGGWSLPMLSPVVSWPMALKLQRFQRRTERALPTGQPTQAPFSWDWGNAMKNEVHVQPGDSLEVALEDLADGGLVRLASGTFRVSNLTIMQPLRLHGSGMDATEIVSSDEVATLFLEGEDSWNVQDITLRHEGEAPASCLLAFGGQLQVTRCRFLGAVSSEDSEWGSGLQVAGRAAVTVSDCQASKCDCGFELNDLATGTVRNNLCQDCEVGILVSGAATPLVESNRCQRNDFGILYTEEASGVCRGNQCTDCKEAGIRLEDDAAPTLEGNCVEAPVAR